MSTPPSSGSLGNTPGSPIDTGTGGFSIDGLANTYDIGDGQAGVPRPQWSSGQIKIDTTKRDISSDTKKTLASYLSKTTLGQTPSSPSTIPNAYPIAHEPEADPVTLSLTDENGYPQNLVVVPASQPHFADVSNGRSVNSTSLNVLIGREAPTSTTTVDGNTLLHDAMQNLAGVQTPPDPGSVNSGVLSSAVIKDYTEKSITPYAYNNDRFVPADKSLPLRNLAQLESQPHNSLIPQDLPTDKKVSLADYLGKSTERNVYPIDKISVEEKIVDSSGNPVPPHQTSNSNSYIPFNSLGSYSVSAYGIKKGKETSSATVDGNTLLKHVDLQSIVFKDKPINTLTVDKPIEKFYSATILSNRFSSEKSYEDNSGINSKQFAKKYPSGKSLSPDDPSRELTFGRLAQIGNVLSLRASQELNSLHDEFNPTDGSAATGALLPGKAQLGVEKISTSELTAASVIAQLTKDGIGEELLINPAGESWGSLNNNQDQFAGISAFGMQLLAVALIVALSIIMLAMSAIFAITPGTPEAARSIDDADRRTFGSWTEDKIVQNSSVTGLLAAIISGKFNFWRMLGIEATVNPVEKCLATGALAFFGVDSGPNVSLGTMAADAAIKAVTSVTESPGYYSVVARNVSRSYLQISDAFASIGKAFSSGMTSGIKQLVAIIDILRNSKFIRIIGVFSHLGDQILNEKTTIDTKSKGSGWRHISDIDNADNNAGGKGRLTLPTDSNGNKTQISNLTLSWASYRAKDLLIMPNQLRANLQLKVGGDDTPNWKIPLSNTNGLKETEGATIEGIYSSNTTGRIETEIREKLEDSLDSEYVPFYFHDVRTNEIISFHAFLASLSDDYTANYDSAEGIGRVETIKTYKSTHRKIGFSFYIAATNPNDFDSMWIKINKLTTLLYPQYTEGRRILLKDANNIIMPFSQVIQSSPMIRLRIGDLIKSNYSKFGLSRLFGADNIKSMFNSKNNFSAEEAYADTNKAPKYKKYYTYTSNLVYRLKSSTGKSFDYNGSLVDGLVLKCQKDPDGNDTINCSIEIDEKLSDALKIQLTKNYGKGAPPSRQIIGEAFDFKKASLSPTNDTLKKIEIENKQLFASTQHGAYTDSVNDFMNDKDEDKGNAIVKSFRSSGGRGLAGFIDSMNFDWYDKATWEIDKGRKAPKMCKVTISFSPIHDISPGLDYNGFNRAPIYTPKGLGQYVKNYTNKD